ncbi:MAG: DUF4149 domain-containing protein [Myxococcales bacterium]|nr:DUF4149 domain-containing protein [Myxococcales bacterium]
MYGIYLLSVWLHILAAITWIGGIAFLVFVVVPWLRRSDRTIAVTFLRETGERFRAVGWICFAILLVTGTYNLWFRGVRFGDFVRSAWLHSTFGKAVVIKLALFVVVLIVSAIHDVSIGPRAALAMEQEPGSLHAERLRRKASMLGRLNALLALALVAAAVVIVRGWPW